MYRLYVDDDLLCDSRINDLAIIDPVLSMAVNNAGILTFSIPESHPFYNKIQRRKSIISVYDEDDTNPLWKGFCISEKIDFYKNKYIQCEGELSYLNDSILRQSHRKNKTVLQLLTEYISEHNEQVDEFKRFEIGNVTVSDPNDSITCFTNMESTLSQINDDLVDDLGGYIVIRYENGHKYIDYLDDATQISNQNIELGVNMMDYTSNIDDTDLTTVVIPLGSRLDEQVVDGLDKRLDITSVNDGRDYIESTTAIQNFGRISRVVEFDNVTDPANLKSKGEKYLSESQFENVYVEVTAIDLGKLTNKFNRFQMLQKIHVVSSTHGMDKWFVLTKRTLHLNEPEKDTFVFGKKEKISMSAKNISSSAEIKKKISDTTSFMHGAIEQATALISGANGGYVVMNTDENTGKPYEILVMDTDSIDTATKVWRWNQNGFGYSSTGYNGEYGTAITMDGSIVADYIKAGTMTADRIRGGILSMGGYNNRAGKIEVMNSSNAKCLEIANNGMRVFNNESHIGNIGSGSWSGHPELRSLSFQLTSDGSYMVWGVENVSSGNYDAKLIFPTKEIPGTDYTTNEFNFGANIDMQARHISNLSLDHIFRADGEFVYSGTVNVVINSNMNTRTLTFKSGLLVSVK